MDYRKILRAYMEQSFVEDGALYSEVPGLEPDELAELEAMADGIRAAAKAAEEESWAMLRAQNPGLTDMEIRQKVINDSLRLMLESIENSYNIVPNMAEDD